MHRHYVVVLVLCCTAALLSAPAAAQSASTAPAVSAPAPGATQGAVSGTTAAAPAAPVARAARGWGRISFMAQGVSATDGGRSLPSSSELVTSATWVSPTPAKDGNEFRVDFRASAYPQAEERDPRLSAYDAWVGRRFAGGNMAVRVGQISKGQGRAGTSSAT